jgi:hypothetical protein
LASSNEIASVKKALDGDAVLITSDRWHEAVQEAEVGDNAGVRSCSPEAIVLFARSSRKARAKSGQVFQPRRPERRKHTKGKELILISFF